MVTQFQPMSLRKIYFSPYNIWAMSNGQSYPLKVRESMPLHFRQRQVDAYEFEVNLIIIDPFSKEQKLKFGVAEMAWG